MGTDALTKLRILVDKKMCGRCTGVVVIYQMDMAPAVIYILCMSAVRGTVQFIPYHLELWPHTNTALPVR